LLDGCILAPHRKAAKEISREAGHSDRRTARQFIDDTAASSQLKNPGSQKKPGKDGKSH
jgi:hypothetical protein